MVVLRVNPGHPLAHLRHIGIDVAAMNDGHRASVAILLARIERGIAAEAQVRQRLLRPRAERLLLFRRIDIREADFNWMALTQYGQRIAIGDADDRICVCLIANQCKDQCKLLNFPTPLVWTAAIVSSQCGFRSKRAYSTQLKPSRASSANDSDGPQVPAA